MRPFASKLDFDCKRMVLTQRKETCGERLFGKGYIRQQGDGTLAFKIYVTRHYAKRLTQFVSNYARGNADSTARSDAYNNLERCVGQPILS